MTVAEPRVRKWTRDEYHQMGEMGLFEGQRVELIEGEVVEMAPQKDVHAIATGLVRRAVAAIFEPKCWVREQMPLSLLTASEPEPDVSVIAGDPDDFGGKGHPKSAELVVEVSDTTLAFDLGEKASLYAAAGIADYWVLDLNGRRLHVHRRPVRDESQPYGYRYGDVTSHERSDEVVSLAQPSAPITVVRLIPRVLL
jgi:Uma2 family endonuclease